MNIKRALLSCLILAMNNNAYCAFWELPGKGYWAHQTNSNLFLPVGSSNLGPLDATGEKIAFCGRIYYPGGGANFTIDKASFRFGTAVTKVSGSSMTVSLQDVSETAGPPMQPDGTMDQSVDINNNDTSFVAYAYIKTGSFSGGGRTVAFGDNLCVVIEFNSGGRLGSDSVQLAPVSNSSGAGRDNFNLAVSSLSAAATWTIQTFLPAVVFEDSSGNNFASFQGGPSYYGAGGFNLTATSTPDEIALSFWNPYDIKINGIYWSMTFASANPITTTLYEGTTPLYSVVSSSRAFVAAAVVTTSFIDIPETTLTANTTYYIGLKAGLSGNCTLLSLQFADPRYKDLMTLGGQSHNVASRKSAGAWTIVKSSAPGIAYRISAIDRGSGGAAAGTKGWTYAN